MDSHREPSIQWANEIGLQGRDFRREEGKLNVIKDRVLL